MKRSRKWIRKGQQVTMLDPKQQPFGGVVRSVHGLEAYVEAMGVDLPTAVPSGPLNWPLNLGSFGSSYINVMYPAAYPLWPITRDGEGRNWIRDWHKPTSETLRAFLAAHALARTA